MLVMFVMIEIGIFIVFGAGTGLLAGLLGIGGGMITVPVVYFTLRQYGYPEDQLMHVAVATSLASTVITAFGASWSHHQKNAVRFDASKPMLYGLLFGCIAGALIAKYLDNELLRYIFGSAIMPLSLYFFFPRLPHANFAPSPNWTLIPWGFIVGILSSILGVGGGLFFIPILLGYNLPMLNTIATSSASTLASAIFGTLTFLVIAYGHAPLPYTVGYIYIPAFFAIGLSSILMTPIGAKLSHTLPTHTIKRIFACALVATGITMLVGH